MLTSGDEYPIHQTPEPIAFSGTDRNFYDRYFFSGAHANGSGYFAVAFGCYPHLGVADAHLSLLGEDGVQRCIHASQELTDRMRLQVGPLRIEVVQPLRRLRLTLASTHGVAADLECEGRAFPVTEPRFTRRQGARLLMDLTRFTQTVRWSGRIVIDGREERYEPAATFGVRDRSWGVRPIGAPDAQPIVPQQFPQFYWLWAPTTFPNGSFYFHVNEDAGGRPWNRRAVWMQDGADRDGETALPDPGARVEWLPGRRHARSARMEAGGHVITWEPIRTFHMKGVGYGHPDWAHGLHQGPLKVAREDFATETLDPLLVPNLHVQAICRARHEGHGLASEGLGVLEQLVIGPHAPSGFEGLLDGARA